MNLRLLATTATALMILSACDRAPATQGNTAQAAPLDQAVKTGAASVLNVSPPVATPTPPTETNTAVPDLPADEAVINAVDPAMPFPDEVTDFMVTRDGCDHFRGEEPYDAERRAYLEESIRTLCTGTDEKLADLRRRYRRDGDVMSALKGYEGQIEASPQE